MIYLSRKKPISVIVPAYKSSKYIQECLRSINDQYYFVDYDKYEILVGVDACYETLEAINSCNFGALANKLRIFWFKENVGPYLIKNTLVKKSKYDIISFFDSDDIMKKDHVGIENVGINEYNIAGCVNFIHPNKDKVDNVINIAEGVITICKNIFLDVNGFDNWRCAADSDLIIRLKMNNIFPHVSKKVTLLRRIHDKNLTIVKKYKHGSEYRNSRIKITKNRNSPKLQTFAETVKVKELSQYVISKSVKKFL